MNGREFILWFPGGNSIVCSIKEALDDLKEINRDDSYAWEVRIPGIDAEDSWDMSMNPARTLVDAVNESLPHWHDIGISFEQAVLICFDAGLVLSTGVSNEGEEM